MQRPKITVFKKIVFSKKGHYRYCSPYYIKRGIKVKVPTFNLEPIEEYNKHGEMYPILNISTEKELVTFLANTFGFGEYRLHGHLKGRDGSYIFWNGLIEREGWMFYNHESDKKEIEKLKDELAKAETTEDVNTIQEDIEFFKEIATEEKKVSKYGFAPFLRPSARRGEYNLWEDPDNGLQPKQIINKNSREVQDVNEAW
jgi:hypothetical protein